MCAARRRQPPPKLRPRCEHDNDKYACKLCGTGVCQHGKWFSNACTNCNRLTAARRRTEPLRHRITTLENQVTILQRERANLETELEFAQQFAIQAEQHAQAREDNLRAQLEALIQKHTEKLVSPNISEDEECYSNGED